MRFDGYIRVSDTKGRGGESFLSPAIQRDTIERLAKAKSIELGEIVEEIDVSGGKRIEDRELGRLLERVETGESAGVIVWKLSRFSRSLLDAVEATTRITRRTVVTQTGERAQGTPSGGISTRTARKTAASQPQAPRRTTDKGRPPQGRPFFLLPHPGDFSAGLQERRTSGVSKEKPHPEV